MGALDGKICGSGLYHLYKMHLPSFPFQIVNLPTYKIPMKPQRRRTRVPRNIFLANTYSAAIDSLSIP